MRYVAVVLVLLGACTWTSIVTMERQWHVTVDRQIDPACVARCETTDAVVAAHGRAQCWQSCGGAAVTAGGCGSADPNSCAAFVDRAKTVRDTACDAIRTRPNERPVSCEEKVDRFWAEVGVLAAVVTLCLVALSSMADRT